jgi:acylglycerol lipase
MAKGGHNFMVSAALALLLASSSVPAPAKAPAKAARPDPGNAASASDAESSFDEIQSRAFVLVMSEKLEDALKLVESAVKQEKNPAKRLNLTYLLSAIEYMDEDYDRAITHLQTVLDAQPAPKTPADHLNHILILKRIGDCYYGNRNVQPALSHYNAALLETAVLPADNNLTAPLLESITGTLVFGKKFAEAENTCKRLLDLASERAKSDSIEDVGMLFWAKIQMLGIYRSLGKEEERKALWASSLPLMDKVLVFRAKMDFAVPDLEKMKTEFEKRYIAEFHPASPAEYLWLASEFKMRTLPLIMWPSKQEKTKAAILCIHGLGLENRAFTAFGRVMAERGYTVYALDVRGFGAWQATQGQEDVQFKETLKDIGSILALIKQREHGLPVFLLGESMGGAIALRGAAAYGASMSGVISSVPSAERFQQRRMSLSVAYHFLHGVNKPFRVGDMVTEQATSSKTISDMWKSDSKAKMDMSPKELIKFAVFMRTTKGECERITTPVFLVQGLKDRLVKPEGTYQFFDAVKSDDKNMFLLGLSEHLIFETNEPSKLLLDALCAWIDDHCKPAGADINNPG